MLAEFEEVWICVDVGGARILEQSPRALKPVTQANRIYLRPLRACSETECQLQAHV